MAQEMLCVSVLLYWSCGSCALLAVRWWEYLGWKIWFLPVKQVRQLGLL